MAKVKSRDKRSKGEPTARSSILNLKVGNVLDCKLDFDSHPPRNIKKDEMACIYEIEDRGPQVCLRLTSLEKTGVNYELWFWQDASYGRWFDVIA